MVCEKIIKLRSVGQADYQERLYIMTPHRIYTFKTQLKSREYYIKDVCGIFQSNQNCADFTIFFERSDDLYISTSKR